MNDLLKRDVAGGHIGHAYLLFGDDAATEEEAYAFASALYCENPEAGLACGHCRRCRQRQAGNFSELVVLEPKKKTYLKEQITEMLKYTNLTNAPGRRRIFWLKKADRLGEICSDSLLKTLEEPVEGTLFLLTVENDDRVAETILSRCRVIHLSDSVERAGDDDAEVFHLLSLVQKESFAYLFRIAEKYAKERTKEEMAAFYETAAALFDQNYAYRHGGEKPEHCFPSEDWSEAALFDGWKRALSAPILSDHAIQQQLILENFLLDIKRNGNGGRYGNNRRSTL